MISAGTPGKALRPQRACPDNLTFPGSRAPILGMESARPCPPTGTNDQSLRYCTCLQFLWSAELSSARDLYE